MKKTSLFISTMIACGLLACNTNKESQPEQLNEDTTSTEVSKELKTWAVPNLGQAAEAYFSPDGKSLIFNGKIGDDTLQEGHHTYTVNIDGTNLVKINSKGQDACSYYFPDGKRLVFTSTKDNLDMPKGDWSKSPDYPQGAEIYSCNLDGSDVKRLTNNKYYDAEVSISPDGQWILFSRQIDGKLDMYRMRPDGTEEFRITDTPDLQEGGAFYLLDNETILYRAWKMEDDAARSKPMQIFTIKHDGTEQTQITNEEGVTNWAPHFAPDGEHFTFAKKIDSQDPNGHGNFEIFLMSLKTKEQTRLTFNEAFDGFPVISPDGKMLTFSSGRDVAPGQWKLFQYIMDISSLNIGPKQ